MAVNNIKRDTYGLDSLVKLVKEDLSEFKISEVVIESVLKSYFKVKAEAISQGQIVVEKGLGTQSLNTRGVSSNFAKDRFTVKVVTTLDPAYKDSIIRQMKTDKNLQEIMGFEYKKED